MKEVEQILDNEIAAGKAPSVQYYLFNEEKIIKHFCSGFANIHAKQPADAETTYHAFSVTKTFTALAVMQLMEREQLSLDVPVINYLPDFTYNKQTTVRHILTHSAGIPNPIPLSWIHLVAEHKSFDRNQFFRRIFDRNRKTKSEPNEKFLYSNLGYVILGRLIEKVSGKTYEDYISEHIIKLLALNPDDLGFEIVDFDKHAKGYHKQISFTNLILGLFINKSKFMNKPEGKWKPFKNFYVNGVSYGGLIGKPAAFVTYIQGLLKDDSRLIAPEFKQLLFRENISNKNKSTGMCLSWFKGNLDGTEYFTHAGGGGGFYCEIRIYPDAKLGSVIFFNRTGMMDERFLDKVDNIYFKG